MENNLGYLFAAFAITWIAIAAYLLYLDQQIRSLREDARALRREGEVDEGQS